MHTETTLSYKNRQFLLEETTANTYTAKEKKEKKTYWEDSFREMILCRLQNLNCFHHILLQWHSCGVLEREGKVLYGFLWFLIQVYVPVTLTLCWLIFQVKKINIITCYFKSTVRHTDKMRFIFSKAVYTCCFWSRMTHEKTIPKAVRFRC